MCVCARVCMYMYVKLQITVETSGHSKCQDLGTNMEDSSRCGAEPTQANKASCMCVVDDRAGEVRLPTSFSFFFFLYFFFLLILAKSMLSRTLGAFLLFL